MKWQVCEGIISSKIDNEVVLMSIKADSYFTIDSTGSCIWEMLVKNPLSLDDLVNLLLIEYDIDETSCRTDVVTFLKEMADKNLICQAN